MPNGSAQLSILGRYKKTFLQSRLVVYLCGPVFVWCEARSRIETWKSILTLPSWHILALLLDLRNQTIVFWGRGRDEVGSCTPKVWGRGFLVQSNHWNYLLLSSEISLKSLVEIISLLFLTLYYLECVRVRQESSRLVIPRKPPL